MILGRAVIFLAALAIVAAPLPLPAAEPPTYRTQIAPILYKNCTSCHHTGGSGPFPLETFADATRWGALIHTVTESRYMPPWLPSPESAHFQGERRLPQDDIATLAAWVANAMPEGAGPIPHPPAYTADWSLGPPDLIVEMPAAMTIPASGSDLFENFVLPVSIPATRWVRAMEIKPGSPQVTHHANVILDRTASIRRAHPTDWQRGIPGMDILVDSGDDFDPDSHFLFWKPDSTTLVEPDNMPWRLDPGNDLVLNMHLKPTGKPESIRARIGLYFTDRPATARPMLLQLESDAALDIPAGNPAFTVEDSLQLPVAVDVLGVYPHAHYLGKRMEAWATLPAGERRNLILIDDWDIDRQSVYRLAQPISLPANAVVHMRYTYDNSAANIRNPSTPPIRVHAGNRSADEMAHFWLQVLPHPTSDLPQPDPRIALEQAWMEHRLQKSPTDDLARYNLASIALQQGNPADAAELYRAILAQHPEAESPRTITALGSALVRSGDEPAAAVEYRKAIAKDPTYTNAIFDLASLDLRQSNLPEAQTLFGQLIAAHPEDIAARSGLAATLLAAGDQPAAAAEFDRVLAADPANFDALYNLAEIALQSGDLPLARTLLTRALAARDDPDAHHAMALLDAAEEKPDEAATELEAWARVAPKDPAPHRALAQVEAQRGHFAEALRHQRAVLDLDPTQAADWNDLGVLEARAGDKAAARRDLQHALALDPSNQAAAGNLSRL